MSAASFWAVTPQVHVGRHRRFGGKFFLHTSSVSENFKFVDESTIFFFTFQYGFAAYIRASIDLLHYIL